MPRYIDADAIHYVEIGKGVEIALASDIDKIPTIFPDDVRGVGKWIRISGYHLDHEYHPARYQCDQCKHFIDSGDDRNYCPNCGARMKGADDNASP